jgi:hypothetical protein
MRLALPRLAPVALALGILACASPAQAELAAGSADPRLEAALRSRLFDGPTPAIVSPQIDPESTEWEQARAAGRHPACDDVGPLRYLRRQVDLDGDGRPELLALVVGSYTCGSRGCTLMVFRDGKGSLEPVAENGLFQSPLRLLPGRHGGWRDLGMAGSRDGVASGWLELQFDGLAYRPGPLQAQAPDPAPLDPPPLLAMPAVPFERLGLPLACPAH